MNELHKQKHELLKRLKKIEVENIERKNRYLTIIETCQDSQLFKSTLLFNTAALDSYIAQTKNQAHDSFLMAKRMCYIGFVIIAAGITIGLLSTNSDQLRKTNVSVITTGCGVLIELISAVVLVFYGKTLEQFNSTLNKIADAQKTSLELIEKQFNTNHQLPHKPKGVQHIE
jgi:hypothetical protein